MSYEKTYQELRSEVRKTNKPLMEKRRRARINVCLSQLKGLVLSAMRKDTSRYSKLEKADVLEMTVKHLKSLQRQSLQGALNADPTVQVKYRTGYADCVNQVLQYCNQSSDLDPALRGRLLHHLSNRVHSIYNAPSGQITNYDTNEKLQRHQNRSTQHRHEEIRETPVGHGVFVQPTCIPMTTKTLIESTVLSPVATVERKADVSMVKAERDVAMVTREVQPLDLSPDYRRQNRCDTRSVAIWRPW